MENTEKSKEVTGLSATTSPEAQLGRKDLIEDIGNVDTIDARENSVIIDRNEGESLQPVPPKAVDELGKPVEENKKEKEENER